jgi:hypothetical protein
MTLSVTKLAGSQVLVEGRDPRGVEGQEILDSTEWDSWKQHNQKKAIVAEVDADIEAFLAPLTAAFEKLESAGNAKPELDPLFYVTEGDDVEPVAAERKVITRISRDSAILRAIESGQQNRLVWVKDRLVITAEPVPYVTPTVTATAYTGDDSSSDQGEVGHHQV